MAYDRGSIEDKYKWKLSDIFASDEEFEKCFSETEKMLPKLGEYQDKLEDEDKLFECLTLSTDILLRLTHLLQYSHMHLDENTLDANYKAMSSRVDFLCVRYSAANSFIVPEISEFPTEKLKALIANKRFKDYDAYLKDILRSKNVILSKAEEKLLGEVNLFAETNMEVFTMFDNADIKFKPILDENGKETEVTHGMYGLLLENPDERVRKDAFESIFGEYKAHANMLAENYAGNVKKDWFFAKVRGFKSSLDYSMYNEDVPSTCYKKLLEAVGNGTKPLHEYMALRKRVLGVEHLNMYDLFLPLVAEQKIALEYEDAVKLVKEALSVMGKEYGEILSNAFESGWVDVYESKGKRTGAYAWGVTNIHPYVLLNYHPTIHDVFTIAHELGHAMHSHYSMIAQPHQKAEYVIFVAEIASTVNEVLLLKHLLKTATGDFRKFLLAYYLDMFRTTFFRQTMFSEFEEYAHSTIEKGEPLTADGMCEKYYSLNKKYYGDAVEHNELIAYEWSRVPHFYTSYYVYKYATGITTAVSIANNILEQGEKYFEKYKKFLEAGCSLPPLDIIRLADVDLESDAPYEKAIAEFNNTLSELKAEFGIE